MIRARRKRAFAPTAHHATCQSYLLSTTEQKQARRHPTWERIFVFFLIDMASDDGGSKEGSTLGALQRWLMNLRTGTGSYRLWQLLLLLSFVGCISYIFLVSTTLSIADERQSFHISADSSKAHMTVVMNTFKRHDMMVDAIDYYVKCPVVKYVYIIWSEKIPVPSEVTNKYRDYINPRVIFHVQEVDSLNNRFKPLPDPHTDAIFSVDDDIRVPCSELQVAYEIWKSAKTNMVGFFPRLHVRNRWTHQYEYRCWWRTWWHGAYSIILTKASILHHDYFHAYTTQLPQSVHKYVDDRRNCEDIAMQFLISNMTDLAPIYVKGHLKDMGALGGISTSHNVLKAGHMQQRDECINDLIKFFGGKNPLRKAHYFVDAAADGWTNQPSTWYEYISSDLWKWS